MSAQSFDDSHDPSDRSTEWFYRLGLHEPDRCAARMVQSLADDPLDIIGFTAIAVSHLGAEFCHLVEWLAGHERSLRTALPAIAAALPWPPAYEHLLPLTDFESAMLPQWLREIDKLECSGIMRRFDVADRSTSSYLIEVRFADEQVSTGRLSLSHGDIDTISEFWTTALSLDAAARLYRKRYAKYTTRPYRHIKPATAGRRIIEALVGSLESGQFQQDLSAPIPWPQNMPVLGLMLQPALALIDDDDG